MTPIFRFVALPSERFAHLRSASDAELRALGALRAVADEKPGYPCRVSLADAEPGESVVLLPFVHLDVASPYRASGPIYVRPGAPTARPAAGEVPAFFSHRLLSVRAYDADDLLVAAEVVPGGELAAGVADLLGAPSVRYLQVHNARPGCFMCRVERAG